MFRRRRGHFPLSFCELYRSFVHFSFILAFFFLNFKRFSNIREIKLLSLIQVANVFLSSFGHLSFDFIYMWFAMHLSYFYVDEFISLGLPLNFES